MARLKNKYYAAISLFWSDEDGGYIADVTEINPMVQLGRGATATMSQNIIVSESISISAGGKTPRLALKELGVALQLALETYEEDNKT